MFRGGDPRDRDGGRDRDRDGRRRGGDRYEDCSCVLCSAGVNVAHHGRLDFFVSTAQALCGLFDLARATLLTLRSPQTSLVLY